MSKITELSVVIPVFNEKGNIEPLIEHTEAILSKQDLVYEIVAVDDKSTDGTLESLQKLSKKCKPLKVVCHEVNSGQSSSVLNGIRSAQYQWIATIDGDGQNDPEDIPNLLKKAEEENMPPYLLVVGNRKKRHDNALRRFSTWVGFKARKGLLGDDCPDTGCSLKVFRKSDFLTLPHFDHFHRFMPALFKRSGGKVVSVPVKHHARLHGVSKYGTLGRLRAGIVDILGVMWLQRRACKDKK